MGEMEKLGIGADGSDEATDLGKIIQYMKKHDPKAQKQKKKKKNTDTEKKEEGEEGKKEGENANGDDDENDDDDDDDEEQAEETEGEESEADKKKKSASPSVSALRKSRPSVDRRVYKRAQELLESGQITDEWIAAAFRHIGRASAAAEDARRTNIVFALNEEPLPSMAFQVEEAEGKFTKRPEGRPAWSYVLNTHGELPPRTPRQLRAEAKQRKVAREREAAVEVSEEYIARYFVNLRPRSKYVEDEFKKIDKERAAATKLGKDKETGEPYVWTDEIMERLAIAHVKQQRDRWEKAGKELDKEAKALLKTKTIDAQAHADMLARLAEDDRKTNLLAKLQRENDKELAKLFVPAIHHPARNGHPGEKEIFAESPGALSPAKVKEMASRLSTDFVATRAAHLHELEQELEGERYRFVDERSRAVFEAQKRPLSAEEQKELGERLAIPIIRSPAPR